jgi:4-aminobutyrate aminotransferase-like enzyme
MKCSICPEEEHVLPRVTEKGGWLGDQLRAPRKEFPFTGDVRGLGYMWGVEFADPVTAAPPDPALDVTGRRSRPPPRSA